MQKKLILISGSPCVGKTAVGTRLFESYDNIAYLDGDWCRCEHPFYWFFGSETERQIFRKDCQDQGRQHIGDPHLLPPDQIDPNTEDQDRTDH